MDQPKRYGDEMDVRPMKPAAVHVAPADQRAVSKNPMRNVPDFTGGLSSLFCRRRRCFVVVVVVLSS